MGLFGKKLWLPDMLEDGFRRGQDEIFVLYQRADGTREGLSYRAIREAGERLAQRLARAGLCPGDRLAVVSAMRPWWYSVLYAATLGHYRLVCIDPGIPLPDVHRMLRQTQARCVFTTVAAFRLPAEWAGRIPVYDMAENFPARDGCEQVDALLESASPLAEDAFFLLFSSGTTGERRKCVLLPHSSIADAIEWNMATDAGIYKNVPAYSVHKRDLMLFPPYHIAGLLCAVFDLYCNTQIIMLERLTPHNLMSALRELRPDNICTVPTMLTAFRKQIAAGLKERRLARPLVSALLALSGFLRRVFGWKLGFSLLRFVNKKALGGNLRSFMIGSSPCDGDTMRFFLDMGIDVVQAYGLTELGAPLAVTGQGYYPGTTGRVPHHGAGMDVRIASPDERGRGEIEVLSPFRMLSYLDPADQEGCFTAGGYFKTGDLGYFDARQCLIIEGRAKESIVLRNGEKLLPEEIEKRYADISGLAQLAAFRVAGESGCDAFSLAAVKDKSQGWPDSVLRVMLLDRASALPAMYRPREVYVLKALPLSSTRKVQRFRLEEMAEKGLDAPVSEALQRSVTEDASTATLRALLARIAGPQWQTVPLTEGLPLELDSLQSIELFTEVQETFGVDLFRLTAAPETFGALLEAVTAYDVSDKKETSPLDLAQYPQPVSGAESCLFGALEQVVSLVWNVRGRGQENIPASGNFLICSNHLTALDPAWISACLPRPLRRRTAIVGKSTLLEDRHLRAFARSRHLVPVDRTGNSLATLHRCRELLSEGWNVEIFPEGTNYENAATPMPFKEGAARLAIASGKTIVPVRIRGVKPIDVMHKTFLPPTGGKVQVIFGAPISPEGYTPAELTSLLHETISAL